jgi:hypothetical protein
MIMFMTTHAVADKSPLHWSRVDATDSRIERDLKMIVSARDFQVLSGSRAVTPCYYRGRDRAGNAITIQVVADDMAA